MRRWLIRGAVVVLIAVAILAARRTVLAPQPIEVRAVPVERGTVEETITNTRAGTVRARRRAALSSEIGGTVVALPFAEGDAVRAGDVLMRLDDSLPRARLEVAENDLAAARAERDRACLAADFAERELTRVRGLVDDEIVSIDQLDRAENAAITARAACKAAAAAAARAEAALDLARVERDKTVIRAPFDGVVASITAELGEYVTPSPPGVPIPPVIDLFDPSTIDIEAPMDEVDSARIAVGLPVRVSLDPYPDRSFSGTVTEVDPYVDDREAQNRTVSISVALDDEALARSLLPGTSADVEVILDRRDSVLRVPTPAVIDREKVFVVREGVLVEVPVEIGLKNWDYTEIVSGLREGDRVVVDVGRDEVRVGAEVVVVEDATP